MGAQERWDQKMNAEFNPGYSAPDYPHTDARVANAAEFAAFQLFKIREAMEGIRESLGEIAKNR
ncbi:hypothetical protein [Microbaculum sp. FT89]|uniref:hypothetical protein n=1 Tax=Microbaculum sp. FT89 TaxID=3447298 RepID=UPI003F52CEC9